MSQRCHRASQLFRHGRVQFGEGFNREFVNQPAFGKASRLAPDLLILRQDRLRHDRARVFAIGQKRGIMPEWPVYLRGIGVEQQFCGVEPQAMFGA